MHNIRILTHPFLVENIYAGQSGAPMRFLVDARKLSMQGLQEAAQYFPVEMATRLALNDREFCNMVACKKDPWMRPGYGGSIEDYIARWLKADADAFAGHAAHNIGAVLQVHAGAAPAAEYAQRNRDHIMRLLRYKMPNYLYGALASEKLAICIDHSKSMGAAFLDCSPRVVLNRELMRGYSDDDMLVVLQEELLHYFDGRLHISRGWEYRQAAHPLLAQPDKLREIDRLRRDIEFRVDSKLMKRPLLAHTPEEQPRELLVNYFYIKEGLRNVGFSQKAVDEHLKGLCGPEYCAICDAFEQQLRGMGNVQEVAVMAR